MNTEIANAVNAAGDKAQYDTRVKRLLAQKSILAHILVKTVDEFKGMKPEDVVKYIEGEPIFATGEDVLKWREDPPVQGT